MNSKHPFLSLYKLGNQQGWKTLVVIFSYFFSFIVGSFIITRILNFLLTKDQIQILADSNGNYIQSLVYTGFFEPYQVILFVALSIIISLGIFLGVFEILHQRPIKSLIFSEKFNFKNFFQGFAVWLGLLFVVDLIAYFLNPNLFSFVLDLNQYWKYILIFVAIIPFQTLFEEMVFRGYLMQTLSKYFQKPLVPIIISSVIFALIHFSNPEALEYGSLYLLVLFIFGFVLAISVVVTEGLEMAFGIHLINNLYLLLITSYPSIALPTNSIFLKEIDNVWLYSGSMIFSSLVLLGFLAIRSPKRLMASFKII